MEATYTVGSDVDVCRMFDQYLYKVRKGHSKRIVLQPTLLKLRYWTAEYVIGLLEFWAIS